MRRSVTPRPGNRSTGRGVERNSIGNRSRVRRMARKGVAQGHPEPLSVPASTEYRFHFFNYRRRMGLRRQFTRVSPLCAYPRTGILHNALCQRSIRLARQRRPDRHDRISRTHQHRDGDGNYADYRYSTLLSFIRWQFSLDRPCRNRTFTKYPHSAISILATYDPNRTDPRSVSKFDVRRETRSLRRRRVWIAPPRHIGADSSRNLFSRSLRNRYG